MREGGKKKERERERKRGREGGRDRLCIYNKFMRSFPSTAPLKWLLRSPSYTLLSSPPMLYWVWSL
jgi:hypothetical protein